MVQFIWALAIFSAAYLVNIFYISIFYHRGLTHGAVQLRPAVLRFVARTGNWVTGIDPKAWSCMHRMHHLYSDTNRDPHSPHPEGIWGVAQAQLRSYQHTLVALIRNRKAYTSIVEDLDFPVHWLNRKKLWYLPYVLHAAVGLLIAFVFSAPWVGAAYWLGMMSHPVQGWLVNALGHSHGYRNFETSDQSRNNVMVAWLVAGEGFQNNHHQCPQSARFSFKASEYDPGYLLCRWAERLGVLRIRVRRISPSGKPVIAGVRTASARRPGRLRITAS